jgi:sirohydrochlorin cobaltochelatase
MLYPDERSDINSQAYKTVVDEIVRGVYLVSGLKAYAHTPGWIAVECDSEGMAEWLTAQSLQENVMMRYEGNRVFVPCGEHFQLKGEIKNVVTVVAKTTHYYQDHIANEMKAAFAVEETIGKIGSKLKGIFGNKSK